MLGRYRAGRVPRAGRPEPIDQELIDAFLALPALFAQQFEALQFDRAIESVMEAVRKANKYIADTKPWELARSDDTAARLDTVLNTLVEALRCASILLEPIIPEKAHELRKQLGIGNAPYDLGSASEWGLIAPGTLTQPGDPLFPRIDLEELARSIATPEAAAAAAPTAAAPAAPAPGAPASDAAAGPGASGSDAPVASAGSATAGSATAAAAVAALEHKAEVEYTDFAKLELRVVTIEKAEQHPNADKLLVLTVRMGPETRTIVSGIKAHYDPADLVGKKLVAVANLKPVKLRGIMSQGMILSGEGPDGTLGLITLERDLPDGSEVR
jgi:methionyl-tRNA synthetase